MGRTAAWLHIGGDSRPDEQQHSCRSVPPLARQTCSQAAVRRAHGHLRHRPGWSNRSSRPFATAPGPQPHHRFPEPAAYAVGGRARAIREGKDPAFEKGRGLFRLLPFFVLRPLLWFVDLLTNELSVDLPSQDMPRDPFGTAVITNVGPFGIDSAFAPFLPLRRCPMLLLISEMKDRPWVVLSTGDVYWYTPGYPWEKSSASGLP